MITNKKVTTPLSPDIRFHRSLYPCGTHKDQDARWGGVGTGGGDSRGAAATPLTACRRVTTIATPRQRLLARGVEPRFGDSIARWSRPFLDRANKKSSEKRGDLCWLLCVPDGRSAPLKLLSTPTPVTSRSPPPSPLNHSASQNRL